MNLEVLYEDNHCLVVNKPAGLLSQADDSGAETWSTSPRIISRSAITSRATSTSGWSIGSTGRRPASCSWPGPARPPAGCRLSSARGRSRRSTGRSSKERPRATGDMDRSAREGRRANRSRRRWTTRRWEGRRRGWRSGCCDAGRMSPSSSCGRRPGEAISSGCSSRGVGCRSWATRSTGRGAGSRRRTAGGGSRCTPGR